MRYYIADNHFFHANLNQHMDKRGFSSCEEMNEYMIKKWNSRVKRGDEVVILGDFSLGKTKETLALLERLHGILYLVKGNHDKWVKTNNEVSSRFRWIKDYAEMNDNGRKVVCCHYPIMCYNGQFRKDKDGNPKTFMLYGHVHRTQDIDGINAYIDFVKHFPRTSDSDDIPEPAPIQMINCFCMDSDYTPFTLDEWIEVEQNRTNKYERFKNVQE